VQASNAAGVSTSRVCNLVIAPARTSAGAADISFYPNMGPNSTVRSLSVQPDGRPVIAGYFDEVDEVSRRAVARLNVDRSVDSDGALDLAFDPGYGATASVYACEVMTDGRIMLGGSFIYFDGRRP